MLPLENVRGIKRLNRRLPQSLAVTPPSPSPLPPHPIPSRRAERGISWCGNYNGLPLCNARYETKFCHMHGYTSRVINMHSALRRCAVAATGPERRPQRSRRARAPGSPAARSRRSRAFSAGRAGSGHRDSAAAGYPELSHDSLSAPSVNACSRVQHSMKFRSARAERVHASVYAWGK